MKRLGILGGTFDPIHLGHLIIASYAADELQFDQVLFMPAQTPPHKQYESVTPAKHRAALVRAAIEPDPRFAFSDLDLHTDRPSYTADLLDRLHLIHPDAELWFIIGADSLRDFPTWHAPDRILSRSRLAVAGRPGIVIDESTLNALPGLHERTTHFTSPLIDISSTDIRQRVAAGRRITWLVPASVEAYIHEAALYRPGNPANAEGDEKN